MSKERQDQLLAILVRQGGWVTAAQLADSLGVTPRSIRTYVAGLNARAHSGSLAVESGPTGYRPGPGAHAVVHVTATGTPRDRLHDLVRLLLDHPEGINVYDTALHMHVSDATLEADLGRIRTLIDGGGLRLARDREVVRLQGDESALRRLLSNLAHDEMSDGSFRPEAVHRALALTVFSPEALVPFKTALVDDIGRLGYFVNELALSDVLLHIAIAVERVASGRPLTHSHPPLDEALSRIGDMIARLVNEHFGVRLGSGDRDYLASEIFTRVVTPGGDSAERARTTIKPEVESAVRTELVRLTADYGVDLDDESFVLRLALHVHNLLLRADDQAWARNPLTRSLKSSSPMIFELAVSLAGGLHHRLGLPLIDDEIAYLAMHLGSHLERRRTTDAVLTATIVCPGYQELHELLRSSLDRSLGSQIEVIRVITSVDPDWAHLDTDLILTTIASTTNDERIVLIPPFLTDSDIERVQQAAGRIRRTRRLTRLRDELTRIFHADAFVTPLPDIGEEGIIRLLGGRLVDAGLADDTYIDNTIAREHMSSTAFTDALAVPHALQMTARHTAIAIGIADGSVAWGTSRVQVVALAAFSEADRSAIHTVFEQFVEVFTERDSVQRIVRRGTDFYRFVDELVAVIDG